MRWVFDLDGTLVDTRAAHEAAYREVGVEPPEDFHIRPWQDWCHERVHSEKNALLPRHLAQTARLLPAFKILEAMGGEILTNASEESFAAIVAVFPALSQYRATRGKTPKEKFLWLLEQQGDSMSPGVYLDDNEGLVRQVRRQTRWQALSTSGF